MKKLLLVSVVFLTTAGAAYATCTGPVIMGRCHGAVLPGGGDFTEPPNTPYPPPPGTIREPKQPGTPIYKRGERTCTGPIVNGVCNGAVL